MQKQTVALILGSLVLLAVIALVLPHLLPQLLVGDVAPSEQQVEIGAGGDDQQSVGPAAAGSQSSDVGRTAVRSGGRGAADEGDRAPVTVEGRVVDALGAPVRDATIRLVRSQVGRRTAGQRAIPAPVKTSSDGTFRVAGLARGDRRVALRVSHAQHAPGMFDRALGAVREVGEAGHLGLVARLGDLILSKGTPVRGRITDLSGGGIAGATVSVVPRNRNRWRLVANNEELLGSAATDADGYYQLPCVPAGAWSAVATAPRCIEGQSAVFVAAGAREIQIDDIQLGLGVKVFGLVQTAAGSPIPNASVSIRSAQGSGSPRQVGRAITLAASTDAQGAFVIEHVPAAMVRLEVRAAGYLHDVQERVFAEAEESLRIHLRDGLRIKGRVLDAGDNQPVGIYAVRAIRLRGLDTVGGKDGQRPSRAARRRPGGYAMEKPGPRSDGFFVLGNLQEGIYGIAVQSPDHAFVLSQEVEVRADHAAPALVLRLERGASCAGIVVADDGQPIAGARVELQSAAYLGPRLSAIASQAGKFVIPRVPTGAYQLSAVAAGFKPLESESIEVSPDWADRRIVLLRFGGLTGTARGVRSAEYAQVRVFAILLGSSDTTPSGVSAQPVIARSGLEADGTYAIRDLEPGDYLVRAYRGVESDVTRLLIQEATQGRSKTDVRIRGGETSQVDLPVLTQASGTVTGSVLLNGDAARGFRVELVGTGGVAGASSGLGAGANPGLVPAPRRARVATGGSFKFDRVAVGHYLLRARTRDRATVHEEAIEVVANTTVHRDVRVYATSLNGAVTADDGTDVRQLNGDIALLAGLTELPADYRPSRQQGGRGSIRTRLQGGRYVFDAVTPGKYLIVVTIPGRQLTTAPVVIGTSGSQEVTIPAGSLDSGRRR